MFSELLDTGTAYLPKFIAALLILITGFVVAWLVRWVIIRVLRPLEKKSAGTDSVSRNAFSALQMFPSLIFWILLFLFFASACQMLGLTLVAGWIDRLINFLPRILFGAVIIAAGWFGGGWLRQWTIRMLDRMQISYSETFGNLLRAVALIFAVIMAIDQVGINLDFLTTTLEIILAGFLLAVALAFGLGARPSVESIMGLHYLRQNCQVGDRVQIGRWQGVVIEFHATGVELDTGQGRVIIPGRACARQVVQFRVEGEHE